MTDSAAEQEASTRLEDIVAGARMIGLSPSGIASVVTATWRGTSAIEVVFRTDDGQLGERLLYRDHEPSLQLEQASRAWAFNADPREFQLASEALRIRLAHLFDPFLAVYTSAIDPLPHQIEAVYGEMLPRVPLRFLLADDPGAGKTIMAGLLIKELIVRGDLARCLIVAPGSLVEQWQDELGLKLGLEFDLLTRDMVQASLTGNPFTDKNLLIARLDQLSRNEDLRTKLEHTDWDLVVVDEAHKMSASFFGYEVKKTKRYGLGELLGGISRHMLLMSATPHNGKPDDFQLFMALLDPDRFEGKPGNKGVAGAQDVMRRMVKEELLTFEGKPLFPERCAYTVQYELSPAEAKLYADVTEYVREEMNRADRLQEGGRRNVVGFALTVLQRRLASSPEAIYQSLSRRRQRLEARRDEERQRARGALGPMDSGPLPEAPDIDDLDEFADDELEVLEEEVVDLASAAATLAELEAEIATLQELEGLAKLVRQSGTDAKWARLSELLQDKTAEMFDAAGNRRKIIIFTEHRDTLRYLGTKIRTLLGRNEAVVEIHGSVDRQVRRETQEAFRKDPSVTVLLATDAAGEGVNLQAAHLLVNFDLPWNPNRIEQRFGRIHRIGQTEVCHMWNLVASDTREGQVFQRLLSKLDEQSKALGGRVFDVLGDDIFEDESLRDLLITAIRYGEDPDVRARLDEVIDEAIGEKLIAAVEERSLLRELMSPTDVAAIRHRMEEAEARRLQPFYVEDFFLQAFRQVGGRISRRETGRFEITNVPAEVRRRGAVVGARTPIVTKYARVTFDKQFIDAEGSPKADLLAPGHPLLDATVDLILERYRPLLKHGTVLVDDSDESEEPRALIYVEHSIHNAREIKPGEQQLVSRRLEFVEITSDWEPALAGQAPYLDYRAPTEDEHGLIAKEIEAEWLTAGVEDAGRDYAIEFAIPDHFESVEGTTRERVERTRAAVRQRLTDQIQVWDHRANEIKEQELAGKRTRMTSGRARQRADEIQERLEQRMEDLDKEERLAASAPVVLGGALIIPRGLIDRLAGRREEGPDTYADDKLRVERVAVEAVLEAERSLGRAPVEQPRNNKGFDIISRPADAGRTLFIEVKGRAIGADNFTITKNEILTALNKGEDFILALVGVDGDKASAVTYVRAPFSGSGDLLATARTMICDWDLMAAEGGAPA